MLDKRLMKEIKQNKPYKRVMILYGFFHFIFAVLLAFCLADVIHAVFMQGESFQKQGIKLFVFFLLICIRMQFHYLFQSYFKKVAVNLKNKILLQAVHELVEIGPIQARENGSGGLVSSWLEAGEDIEPFYGEYLPQFFSLVITVPLILVVSFFVDPISGAIMLVTGPLLPFFLSLIGMRSKEENKKRLAKLEALGDGMLDFLNGVRTLKLFHGIESYRNIIEKSSDEFRIQTMQVLKIAFLSAFVLEFAATISTALIAVSLGLRLIYAKMDFFPAFFILLITPDYYMAIRKFGAKFHTAMGAKAGADKLYDFIQKEQTEQKPKLPMEKSDKIKICLKNVTYSYDEGAKFALDQISLSIEPGKLTALVGKSGSGKSTLSYLLMQYIKAKGLIEFGTYDVNKFDKKSIQNLISYIPQKPYIFQDTLYNNIAMAKKDTCESEVLKAIEKAALYEFVEKLPLGLETMLTEIGENISIGEAQRIAFARAYLKDAPILIMDEITSALDQENEEFIKHTFESLKKEKTVLVIAHRLATVEHADVIYVMEDGKVVESGDHVQLKKKENGIYKELIQTWEVEN